MKTYKNQFDLRTATMLPGLLYGLILISGCLTAPASDGPDICGVHVSELTTFMPAPGTDDKIELKVVAELQDAKGISVQQPCILRFELYKFVSLSSDARGERLVLWPDISLNSGTAENSRYWKTYLKGYEFLLPLNFIPHENNKYVLEVTCMFEQYRFNDIIVIEL